MIDARAAATAPWRIRPATPDDFDEILCLNAEWEHFTSRLTCDSLGQLHASAIHHRVLEAESRIVAFLLALGPGADYDSPNYRFFDSAADDFIYIDRIVVDREYQRAGLADALYDDLLDLARQLRAGRIVCEVDVEPLNTASDRFHARRGFTEVGTQWVGGGSKRVSLRECPVE